MFIIVIISAHAMHSILNSLKASPKTWDLDLSPHEPWVQMVANFTNCQQLLI